MNIYPITDLKHPALSLYTDFSEVQLLHYHEPAPGLFIAESPNVIERALQGGYEPVSFLVEEKLLTGQTADLVSSCPDVPVYTGCLDIVKQLTGFPMTRGILCAMARKTLPSPAELCQHADRIAILENVMNPTNLGAIFRSAAALGIDAVLLTPGCTDPLYRRSSRVSMGTVFQIPWTTLSGDAWTWPQPAMDMLHSLGFQSAAMALDDRSISIEDPVLKTCRRLAIVLGTEGEGLADKTIQACDYTVKIPMYHQVDSLNVAAASAVAFWELRERS